MTDTIRIKEFKPRVFKGFAKCIIGFSARRQIASFKLSNCGDRQSGLFG